MSKPGDPRTPRDDIGRLQNQLNDMLSRLRDLEAPSGSAANQNVKKLTALVNNIQQQLNDYIANGTYNKSQIDAMFSRIGHRHSASDIDTGTVTGALGVNGDVTGQRGIFPTGIRSTGARNNQLVTNYVAAYIDGNGNLGFAPSTRASKNDLGPYAVDMAKFLAVNLERWTYKDDPEGRVGMGPFAEDLDAAGLQEFVIYSETGKIQGLRLESLVIGLWSAYVQSRTATLARIAKQSRQVVTVPNMGAVTLGGVRSFTITWDKPFADADYTVVATVYNSSGVPLTGVSASSLPSSRTTTGCVVQVASGVTLLAGQTLVVEAVHI